MYSLLVIFHVEAPLPRTLAQIVPVLTPTHFFQFTINLWKGKNESSDKLGLQII